MRTFAFCQKCFITSVNVITPTANTSNHPIKMHMGDSGDSALNCPNDGAGTGDGSDGGAGGGADGGVGDSVSGCGGEDAHVSEE